MRPDGIWHPGTDVLPDARSPQPPTQHADHCGPGERVPQDHPLRRIKEVADAALERLSPEFDRMYARVGRASVPPARLLKACLLIALYLVRSECAFCEEPGTTCPVAGSWTWI